MRILLAAILCLIGGASLAQELPLSVRLLALGAAPCPGSQMPCVTLSLPRDHNAPTNEAIDVKFAVSLASQQPAGIVFYAVGGPGQSGLTRIDSFANSIAPDLRARVDFVFFEPRGTGDAHFVDCPAAASNYFLAGMPPETAVATAQRFADDCLAETPNADLLPFIDTEQSARDLEAFRQAIGSPRVYLQGESYGTQPMQTYAALFPDAVRGMILDGIVDPTLSPVDDQLSQLTAAERVLARVLAACRDDIAACARDFAGDPVAAYEAITARVASAPILLDYPMPDGTASPRRLTANMLSGLTLASLYDGAGRADFLRALAAASHEDFLPLLRLGYSLTGIIPGPETMVSVRGWSDAAYFATLCGDAGEAVADPVARASEMIAEAEALASTAPHFRERLYAERVTCLFWPHRGGGKKSPAASFAGGNFPVLLLASTSDPVIPPARAYALLDGIADSSLVVIEGGPHVAFGRGNACPDRIVAQFLLTGELPATRLQICSQPLVAAYVPRTLPDPQSTTPLALVQSLDIEFWQLPEMRSWTGEGPLAVGCNFGGAVEARLGPASAEYEFRACAFWPGLAVTGLLTEGDGLSRFEIEVSGLHAGRLSAGYEWDTRGFFVSGTWDGETVETPRPLD